MRELTRPPGAGARVDPHKANHPPCGMQTDARNSPLNTNVAVQVFRREDAFMTITTCIFDAYGTLFDVASAARRKAEQPGQGALAEVWAGLAEDWRHQAGCQHPHAAE